MSLFSTTGNIFSNDSPLGGDTYAGELYSPNSDIEATGFGEVIPSNRGSDLLFDTLGKSVDLFFYGQKRSIDAEFVTPNEINDSRPRQQTENGPQVAGQTFDTFGGVNQKSMLIVAGVGVLLVGAFVALVK